VRHFRFVASVADGAEDGRIIREAEMNSADPFASVAVVNGKAALSCGGKKLGRRITEVAIGGAEYAEEAQLDLLIGEEGGRRLRRRQFKLRHEFEVCRRVLRYNRPSGAALVQVVEKPIFTPDGRVGALGGRHAVVIKVC
jgi:hypothetical protein